jgi:hypothetical protein
MTRVSSYGLRVYDLTDEQWELAEDVCEVLKVNFLFMDGFTSD